MIAVGAVSLVAITVTVLSISFSGLGSDKVAVSSAVEGTSLDVRPSIDFDHGPSKDPFFSGETEVSPETASEKIGRSSSRNETLRLTGIAENAQAPSFSDQEMHTRTRAKEEPKTLPPPLTSGPLTKARVVTSSASDGPILTDTKGPTSEPQPANNAAEGLAMQSRGLASGESDARTSFALATQTQTGSVRVTPAGARPDLQPTQLQADPKAFSLKSATTSDPPAAEEAVADDLVTPALVKGEYPSNEVLLLDVELAVASTSSTLPATGRRSLEEAEFIPPDPDAQAISYSASIESTSVADISPYEAKQRIQAEEENARRALPREPSGVVQGSGSSAGAVGSVAEAAPLVDANSEVGALAENSEQGTQGYSDKVATRVRVGGTAAGSLPLQISTDALVSVRLADLISLFEDRMDRPLFVWLKTSSNANEFVTIDTLRSAGIDAQYVAGTQQVALSITQDQKP